MRNTAFFVPSLRTDRARRRLYHIMIQSVHAMYGCTDYRPVHGGSDALAALYRRYAQATHTHYEVVIERALDLKGICMVWRREGDSNPR
jgi:hypothetical protein